MYQAMENVQSGGVVGNIIMLIVFLGIVGGGIYLAYKFKVGPFADPAVREQERAKRRAEIEAHRKPPTPPVDSQPANQPGQQIDPNKPAP